MIYFYGSSNEKDKCSLVSVLSKSEKRAFSLVLLKFKQWGYKGIPQRVIV